MQTIYLNNSIETWLYALFFVGGAIVFAKLIYWIIQKTLKNYSKKTANDLAGIFVDVLEEPLFLAVIILGFWFAFDILTLTDEIRKFVNSIFYFLILFNIIWFLTRFADVIAEKYIAPRVNNSDTDLDDVLFPIVRKLIKIAIWTIAIVMGIDNVGYDVTTMITGLGIGGLVFALAAQDSVSNLFGGIVIFSDKPFRLNDRIILDGFEGYVRGIGLRSTRLETLDGRIVTIPNSTITDNPVLNVSLERGRRIKYYIGLTYSTSVEKMELSKEILKKIVEENEHTIDPVASFEVFGDFSLNIFFSYWIKKGSDFYETQDEINMQILKQFNDVSIEFAFPTQSLYIEKNSNV